MAALSCPSCGANHEPRNPGITVIVCDQCDTTLYLEEDVLKAGIKAIVAEPKSGMAVGKAGMVGDTHVELVGMARFKHRVGFWDEWYVEFRDGTGGWLVEDGRNYTLERQLDSVPEGVTTKMRLGETLVVEDVTYEVREKGMATCVGGKGQLPRPIVPEEIYGYIDLSEVNGTGRLTIEFDMQGYGEAFVGKAVAAEDIHIDGVEPPPLGGGQQADTIRCAQCGSSVAVPKQGKPVETLACTYCDAVLQLTDADNRVIGNRTGDTPKFALDIGDSGELLGQTWEVVGRLRYTEDGYNTDEFLCWCEADNSYLWLEYDDLHFVAMRSALSGPSLDDVFATKKRGKIQCGDKTYQMRGGGVSTLIYVDGALPWAAQIGNGQEYIELIAPPKLFVIESGNGEIEHYEGEWIEAKSVFAAFGRSDRYERPTEKHFLASNGYASWLPAAGAAIVFFFINVCLCLSSGSPVTLTEVRVDGSQMGQAVYSEPFDIPRGANVLDLTVRGNPDNGWGYAQIELIPMSDETDTLAITGLEVNYYTGFEGGEYWSEGDKQKSSNFRAPPPGQYKMAVITEGDVPITLIARLSKDGGLTRYNCCIGSFALLFGGMVFMFYSNRESGRWDTD